MPSKDLEALIRRLVASVSLAGAPLLLSGCSPFARSSCDGFQSTSYTVVLDAGTQLDGGDCSELCKNWQCTPTTTDAGAPAVICQTYCVGRPPSGLALEDVSQRCETGGYLARMAALEQASVGSFVRLSRELAAHGAPASLVAAARRSAADERRHAKSVARLARAHGAAQVRFAPVARSVRPLIELALENATSGCVLETYGAVEAAWQAAHATDPKVRTAMQALAPDEARHAALAWKVEAWAQRQLSAPERRELIRARKAAVTALVDAPSVQLAGLGLPDDTARAKLLAGLAGSIWS